MTNEDIIDMLFEITTEKYSNIFFDSVPIGVEVDLLDILEQDEDNNQENDTILIDDTITDTDVDDQTQEKEPEIDLETKLTLIEECPNLNRFVLLKSFLMKMTLIKEQPEMISSFHQQEFEIWFPKGVKKKREEEDDDTYEPQKKKPSME